MKLKCYSWSVADICAQYRKGTLELSPPYQRRPAWRTRQREDLLESVFNGIPIPAVIVFKTRAGRRTDVFEVMDGKQRLESILHFRYGRIVPGEGKLGFWLRLNDSKLRKRLLYADLSRSTTREAYGIGVRTFMNYKVPVIEYSGDLTGMAGQKIAQWEVFTKINSTGSRLTKNEIRHSHKTPLFDAASRMESRWFKRIVETWRVFSKAEADRFQYHEMLLELCTIYLHGGISDKRLRLDEFMRLGLDRLGKARVAKAERNVNAALTWAKAIMTDDRMKRTRLSKKVDFYSFIGALMDLMSHGAVTKDRNQNQRARKAVLSAISKLERVNERVSRYSFRSMPARDRRLAQYVVATREGTDQLRNRRVRHDFWMAILSPCFPKRLAARRLFGRDLKNSLWNSARVRKNRMDCPNPEDRDDCWRRITFDDAVVDHRQAYSRGGPSSRGNAQLMCRVCNSAKGAR